MSDYDDLIPQTPQASSLTPADQPSAIMSGIRGGLNGMTAGTSKYVGAGMLYGMGAINHLWNPDVHANWDTALETIKDQQAEDKAVNPKSYTAGNIVGSTALGAATGGGGTVSTIAKLGLTGVIQGAAESDATTVQGVAADAVKGGATNVVLGTLGAGVNAVGKMAKNSFVKKLVSEGFDNKQAAEAAMAESSTANGLPAAGVPQVVLGSLANVGRVAIGTGAPVAGAVAGGYVGGQLAPVFGVDKSTGQIIGAELGGGGATIGSYKSGIAQAGYTGLKETLAMAQARHPETIAKAINAGVQATANPAVSGVVQSTNANPSGSFDDLIPSQNQTYAPQAPANSTNNIYTTQRPLQQVADDINKRIRY